MSPGPSRRSPPSLPVKVTSRFEKPDHFGGHIRGHRVPRLPHVEERSVLLAGQREVAREAAYLQGAPRAAYPGCPVPLGRQHRAVSDTVVAEGGAGQQRVEGGDQRSVAAPVGNEGAVSGGVFHGGEVGLDVGAPKGVDRLLGIADHDQPGLVEHRPENLPLDRVGVLCLVDQRDGVAPPQQITGAGADPGLVQRVAGFHEGVIEGDHAFRPQPLRQHRFHFPGHLRPNSHHPFHRGGFRNGPSIRDRDDDLADLGQVVLGDLLDLVRRLRDGEATHHQVTGGAPQEQFVYLAGLHVDGQAGSESELLQQPESEAMDGEDLGAVEVSQCLLEPVRIHPLLIGVGIEQDPHVVVCLPTTL